MQSKNHTTQGLFMEMNSKKIKSPQIERISSLDSGRPPVMIFTSRGKVARKSINSRVFEAFDENGLRAQFENDNLNQMFDQEIAGHNRYINGNATTQSVNSASFSGSTGATATLRRPAPPVPVSNQRAPANGNPLVSSRALSLSSSLQSLNNRHSLESDRKVQPPLIAAPKSFLQRQSSLSSSTSSLSSVQASPTSQLQQPAMTKQQYALDLSLPPPPPDANNNSEEIFQADVAREEYQQISHSVSTKKTRAPEPPTLPSPPPPPSPPPHTPPLSPVPSQLSSLSSSSASSSPLKSFRFPPPPSTPPSPIEIPETHSSFTNTSVSTPAVLPWQPDSDKDRKNTLSPNEVMDYFDEAIGHQAVSASSYSDVSSYPAFSPVFHFPSVSDDKQIEPMSQAIESSKKIPRDAGNTAESTETATAVSTDYYSEDINSEGKDAVPQVQLSFSESKTSEGNTTQSQGDNSFLSPKSEEERKKRGNAASRTVAVSRLRPEVKTVRQYIKPGTVDELANLFSNMKDELITSPENKSEFDFDLRETLHKLESLDKGTENKSPVMRNAKRSSILSPNELFPRIQGSVSAETLQGRPRSLHSPAYTKVNQWPRLYQTSSANSLYAPATLPESADAPRFDFLAASREIHKHVVLIRSSSRAGVTATNKANDMKHDSSKIFDNVSNLVHNTPSSINESLISSKIRNNQSTEDTAETHHTAETYPREETYKTSQENMTATTMFPATEANKKDIGYIDSALITSEMLKDQADSFDAATESPHPTMTPANSKSSSRRSSLEDHRKTETENFAIDVSLNEASTFSEVNRLASSQRSSRSNSPGRRTSSQRSSRRSSLDDTRKKEDPSNYSAILDLEGTLLSSVTRRPTGSRGSSRSNSPDKPTNSRRSSRRSSLEDQRKKEDTSNYSANIDLEGTLSSVVARRPTSTRSSSRSNSPDRKSDFDRTLVLNTSINVSSRSNSMKSEKNGELTSHKLNGSSGSPTSNSPANSKYSSRAGSVRRSGDDDAEIIDCRSFDIENDLVSKTTASFSPSNDTNVETTEMLNRKISLDDHSNATSGGFLSYSENVSSFDSKTIKTENIIVDSHIGISEDYKNTAVFTNPSTHSSRSSSISGSLKIKDKDEINLELPHSTLDTAVGTVSPSSSGRSSRSSSPEKRREDIKATLHTVDNIFSKRDSISSSSRRSSQAEGEDMNSSKPISGDYENIALLDFTSPKGNRNSGSLNTRSNEDEVSLQLPNSFVGTVAVEAGAVSAVNHTSNKSSSRSSSPDRNRGSEDIFQTSGSPILNRTSIISTPERSRRSSQADGERVDFDQTTNEHHERATVLATASGSISSRSTSRSGSVKIRDDTDEVHLEFPSPTEETVDIGTAAVYARNLSSKSSSRGSSSPDRKVSSEDIIQSFEKAFVDRRASISSTRDSSRKSSLTGLTMGGRESETHTETDLTHLDGARTEWTGFLKTDTKFEEESTAVFSDDVENKHTARANISPTSSKSRSREGSLERINIHGGKTTDLKTASSTPSSSRRSSIAGPVLKVNDESEYFNTALENSLGFTVKSAASSTRSNSPSSSVNQDDKQDQEETTHDHVFSSTAFNSNNRKDDLDGKLLKGNDTIEHVTSASSSRSDSPTKNDSLDILQTDYHDKDVENLPIPSFTTPIVSQKSSRESSPERNTASVEHSLYHTGIYENITTSAFTVTESPISSRRSSHTISCAGDIQLGKEENESHMFFKKSASSSNSPASSRRSSGSLEAESTKRDQQLTADNIDMDIRKLEDTGTVTVLDWSSELKSQPQEEVPHASVGILNSVNINTGTSTVGSRRSSQTSYIHVGDSENRQDDTALLISKSSSSSSTTSPAGSRRTSHDVHSVKDTGLNKCKSGSDLNTVGSIDVGSVTDIHVRARSRDSSPDGSLKRTETWDHQETDSYQLALQSALESTLVTSPTTSSRRGSQESFVKRGRETSHSSASSSKNSSRPGSPIRTTDANLKPDHLNVRVENTLVTPAVSSSVFSHGSTHETSNITSRTLTKPEQEVDDAFSTPLSNIEYLGTVSTSVTEDRKYTLNDEDAKYTLEGEDATVYEFTDTHRTHETPTETHVNTADGKHFNMYYTGVGSKLLENTELKETYSSETFLPSPQGDILTSNFGSNVNFSEKENISSADSRFHLARFSSNNLVHSEVSQSMNDDRVDRSSFSASMDMYSQPQVTDDSDEVTSVSYEKENDDSRYDSNPLLDTDDTPAVEYGHTVVDIHAQDKEDSMSQISTLSQFGSDKDMAGDTRDNESDCSDSDNSFNHRSVQAGYTVNEASVENSSAFPIKASVYSFNDFKEGIARTSSSQLSSSHEHQEGMVQEVIPTGYASHSAVVADFSGKDTNWGSRKGSSSSASHVSSGDDTERPATETFKHEDEYEIFQKIGGKTNDLTRQESVKSQLSEDVHEHTGESLRPLAADHTTTVVHKEVTTGATDENETTVTEVRNNMDTETISTNSFYTQLLEATDASTPTLDLDSSIPGLREDTEVTVTPVADHAVASQPKDFLSVLDDINIETDITSRFLRRASRLSGTFTPDRRQSKDIRSDLDDDTTPTNATAARDSVTEATLSSTSFILADYQARDAAYTAQVGNHESANGFSVANQFMDTDITLSDFVDEQKKESVENTVVDHGESFSVATNDQMHTTFDKASQEFAKTKDFDTDLNINYDTIADDMSRNTTVDEMIHSDVRRTEENQTDLFGFSAERDDATSSRNDIDLDSQPFHEVTTEVMQPNDSVSEVNFDNKTTRLYVNDDFSSLSGETDVNKYGNEGQIDAVRADNALQSEYLNDLVYQSDNKLTREDTASGATDFGVGENRYHVHSYVNDVIQHSVDTISTEDMDRSNDTSNWKVDGKEDKHQARTYVDYITQHFDTIHAEDMDRSKDTSDWKVDVKEDKHQVQTYVNDVIRHSVDTVSTEDMDRSNDTSNWKVDVKEDKHQAHTYVDDIAQHFDTIHTEDMDRSKDTSDWKVDVKEDKHHVHSYVNDIIQHSVGSISAEEMDPSGHADDWEVDVKEDKHQVHSYVSDIIQHSVDTVSTEDINKNNVTDWKVETEPIDTYKHETFSEMNVDTLEKGSHAHEFEMGSRFTSHEISDSLSMSFDESDVKRHIKADLHTDTSTGDEIKPSYQEDEFRDKTIYESFDQMEAVKRSSDVHLDFSEGNVHPEHDMHDASPNISGHHEDGFSKEILTNGDYLELHDKKTPIQEYVGDIIHHSIDALNTQTTESKDSSIHGDQVTPSHMHVNHSADREVDAPFTQTHVTTFDQHFNGDSTYVHTSTDHQYSNNGHGSQLDLVVNDAFQEAQLADTALLPSDMYNSLEINADDNYKEDSHLTYEEITSTELHLTNTASSGLYMSNDELEARATDNEETHHRIITGLQTTSLRDSFHESREELNRIDDEDDFISDKYMTGESKDSYSKDIFQHQIDDQNTDAIKRDDYVFEINKQNEFSKASITEPAFESFHQPHVEEHPLTSMQDKNITASKHVLVGGDESSKHQMIEVTGDKTELNIEDPRSEDLHTYINTVTQLETAYGSHIREENKIESEDVPHDKKEKESLYLNTFTAAQVDTHRVDQAETEIDLNDEIRKQHRILSPKLSEDVENDKALDFNLDISSSSRSSISSANSNQVSDHRHTTRETTFNRDFFVRSRSSSDDGKHYLSRKNSDGVTAESSLLFPREDNENKSLAELQHKEDSHAVEEFSRTLNINREHSVSSRSSVSSIDSHRHDHQTGVASHSFRLDNAVDKEKDILPSADSLIVADTGFHSNVKLEYERLNLEKESTDFRSTKASSQKDVIENSGEFVSLDSFGFQDQPERNVQESDADFKSVKQTKEEYIAVARLSQTLRSTSNDEESTTQKEDESHLFSRDKFQALRSVFEKQQEAIPETRSFKTKRNSYKLGTGTSSTSESAHMGNWELNRQVSSASSAASHDKKDMGGHFTSAAQIDDYTSIESNSDRIITKWSESDNAHNPDMEEQVHKKTILNKKLSYDLQTRELRRGSAISSSSIHSASSADSTKHTDMDTHLADNQGEGYSSNVRPDDHYLKNNLFSQKPGIMNVAQWNTQSAYAIDGDYAQTKRKSSTSSNISSASLKYVVRPATAEYQGSSYQEDHQELHSPRETDQSQLNDVGAGVLNPSFSDDSLTEDEEVDFRKRTDKTNSLSSSRSSSLEIEDHSLFSQENIGRFSPSDDQKATYIQASYDIDTVNSEKSSVKSQSTKRSSLGYTDESFSPSDKNFSFRENNQIMTNTKEVMTDNVKPQFVSKSSDRGAAVRRHSSSGSEKEAKIIGAFLRSGASLDMSSRMSRHSSETGSAKSHQSAEPARQADDIDVVQRNRRVSSSSDSTDSVKVDLSRRTGSIRSEISLTEAPENYEDLTSVADHNAQNRIFQSEEAFTVVSHNFSQPALGRDSFTSQEARSKSPTYLSPEEEHDFRWRQVDDGSSVNVDETTVKSYVIKRSISSDVYEDPYEHPHESVFSNSHQGLTQNSPRDFYTNRAPVPETTATEATEMYSETQESVKQRQWQYSPFGMDSINHGVTSKKENLSLENDRDYRDTPGSHLAQGHGEKLYQIKRTGLDTSPIFPSLLNRDTNVQHTHKYTDAGHDQDTYNGGYLSSHGDGFSSSYIPLIQNAEQENVLRLQSRAPHVVDTANFIEKSPTSPGVHTTNIHRNQLSPTEDRFQFSPITISSVSQAVVGDKVGVHIDFSPPAIRHSPDDISSSSDEESNQQRFIVKNIQGTSLLKSNVNNSSSEINFTKEEATTEHANRIMNASGSLSPRTVVDGPIFRTYKSQRSQLSRSLSSDNSLASHHEDNSDFSPTVDGVTVTNNEGHEQDNHLYRVHNVQSHAPEFRTAEADRGRSRNRNTDFSDTKNKTPRKQHHSPERFFKNAKLSLRQEDYDSKGYSSDDEDGKHYRHVTRVYLSGETPRSRSPSPSTRYRVSSPKSQNFRETTRGSTVQENNTQSDVSNVRTSSSLRNRTPEISDNDSESGFQGHQQRYKVIGTSDSSLDKHEVRAQSSPKLDRKREKYYQDTSITRIEAVQPSQLGNLPAAQQTHKSVVQVQVGSNYIPKQPGPEDALGSRYMIKRVRSADNLRDDGLTVHEDAQSSSDRKMWKTGRSRSSDRYLSHSDGVDGGHEPSVLYDLPMDNNKMYMVNSTLSNPRDNHDNANAPHSWHTSTIDINERSLKRTHNLDQSHHDQMNSQNYKTEKTVFISNMASPQPNAENRLHRTRDFVFRDHGQGTEITNSHGGHGYHHNAERFERINEDKAEPHNLDYSRSTEDLSNDLRVLRGKILIKNRFDSSEFSEDDFDQNANLFDTSFHTGKDNPVYSSDPDIAASLRREEERGLSKHVTQDITFETVDKLAQQYKAQRQVQLSPGPQRKKPNLSSLLLSKLALVDSKDIRQTVDVEHHNEEVHGDIRFVHADGELKESKGTYNFDSVNEKVELTLTQGKANVIIKVIAERVIPTNTEFNTWRKSQAIVTRQIEIDLQANEQMKRLYKHVMTKTGKSGSLEGSSRLTTYNSASLSPQERELNSMETLKLFTQILDVAEQQSKRDHTDSGVRHDLGQLPASVMDMLY